MTRQDKTRQDKTRQDNDFINRKLCQVKQCKVIGDLFEENNMGSAAGRIYDIKYLSPCIGASHFSQIKYILVKV